MFFIDIAVPRDVDPEVNKLEGLFVYDIDDLQGVVAANVGGRHREMPAAERIVQQELEYFWDWYTARGAVDAIRQLLDHAETMRAADYFEYAAELMKLHLPHVSDWSIVARMKRLGIEAGESFEFKEADAAVKRALEQAPAAALQWMKSTAPSIARVANGWQMNAETMGVYGNAYLKRAIIALIGLGANQPEDAVYPMSYGDAEGKPFDGTSEYVLHFSKQELPPVGAFWSVTLYDKDGFPAPNALDRHALGDRDPLKYNADGSLDLYPQRESPGKDKEATWLPTPAGEFTLTMRLYAPRPQVLDGRWLPPAVRRAAAAAKAA